MFFERRNNTGDLQLLHVNHAQGAIPRLPVDNTAGIREGHQVIFLIDYESQSVFADPERFEKSGESAQFDIIAYDSQDAAFGVQDRVGDADARFVAGIAGIEDKEIRYVRAPILGGFLIPGAKAGIIGIGGVGFGLENLVIIVPIFSGSDGGPLGTVYELGGDRIIGLAIRQEKISLLITNEEHGNLRISFQGLDGVKFQARHIIKRQDFGGGKLKTHFGHGCHGHKEADAAVNDCLGGLLHEVVTEHEHYSGRVAVKIEDHHQDRDHQQTAKGREDIYPRLLLLKKVRNFGIMEKINDAYVTGA
jgi:hypothetical protein